MADGLTGRGSVSAAQLAFPALPRRATGPASPHRVSPLLRLWRFLRTPVDPGELPLRKKLAIAAALFATITLVLTVVNRLEYGALDLAGSAEAMSVAAALDSGAPVTTCSADGVEHASPYVVTFTAMSQDVGIAETFSSVDGGPFVGGMLVELTTGTHSLRFYSVDDAGNAESIKAVTVTVR